MRGYGRAKARGLTYPFDVPVLRDPGCRRPLRHPLQRFPRFITPQSHCPTPRGPKARGRRPRARTPRTLCFSPHLPSACEFGRGSSGASQRSSPPQSPALAGICTPRPRPWRACCPSSARSRTNYPRRRPAAPPPSLVLGTLNLRAPGGGCGASDRSREALVATRQRGGLGGRRGAGFYREALTAWAALPPGYARRCPSAQSCVLCHRPPPCFALLKPLPPPEQAWCGGSAGIPAEAWERVLPS